MKRYWYTEHDIADILGVPDEDVWTDVDNNALDPGDLLDVVRYIYNRLPDTEMVQA